MVNLGVPEGWGKIHQRKKTKKRRSEDVSVTVTKKTSSRLKATTEETPVIDLAQPRRRTPKQSNLIAAQRPQFIPYVKTTKSKPTKSQVLEEVSRSKRRKQLYCQALPNNRLYQPSLPKFRHIEPPPTPKAAAKLLRTNRPKADSVTVYDDLTDHIQAGQKRKTRSSTKKQSPLRAQLVPVQENKGRKSLVINVPTVNLMYESSPERTVVIHSKHRSTRRSPIFTRVHNSLNSPDQLSQAGDHEFQDSPKTGSLFQKSSSKELPPAKVPSEIRRAIASTSSLFKDYINGHLLRDVSAIIPDPEKATVKSGKAKKTNMSNKDKGSQHSTSPEDFSDANESLSAPSEFLAEFLSAIMQRKYVSALKYCKLILQYEPNNVTAKEFYPLLEEKLKYDDKEDGSSGAELPSAENPPTDISGDSNQNTEGKEDDGLSYNSEDSYVLDDELGEDLDEEVEDAGAAGGADSPLTSSQSSGGGATESDRSIPSIPSSAAGGEADTYNSNNQSGSGYEDEDSSKYEMDDDNGNAVSVSVRFLTAVTAITTAPAVTATGANTASTAPGAGAAVAAAPAPRFACEGNDNDTGDGGGAVTTASNDNYRKNQEELRRQKIQELRSQYVHSVK